MLPPPKKNHCTPLNDHKYFYEVLVMVMTMHMLCNDVRLYITMIMSPVRNVSMLSCITGQEGGGDICSQGYCFRQSQAILGAILHFSTYVW